MSETMSESRPAKRMSESVCGQVHLLTVGNMNGANRLLGGELLTWIDEVSAVCARRHAGTFVTTASVEDVTFLKPLYANQVIDIVARVEHVGNSSMDVCIRTWQEELNGERTLANIAHIIMVALDKDGKACRVPGLIAETDEEREALEEGNKRAERRKKK